MLSPGASWVRSASCYLGPADATLFWMGLLSRASAEVRNRAMVAQARRSHSSSPTSRAWSRTGTRWAPTR